MEPQDTSDGAGGGRDLPEFLGPYEYWNFGPGKDYAFPALHQDLKYLTAFEEYNVKERREEPASPATEFTESVKSWPPTLWKELGLTFAPFVIEQRIDRLRDLNEFQKELKLGLAKALENVIVGPRVILPHSRFRLAYPVPDRAMHAGLPPGQGPYDPESWNPDDGLYKRIGDKRITVVAVIDDGLPFAHRNFRDKTGCRSRVEFCWLQSVATEQQDKPTVLFGREYIRSHIEELIAEFGSDEDALYRAAGAMADADEYGSLLAQHATHGAHVMDLATGYAAERGDEPPEEIRIIAVQLPNLVTVDTSGFGKDAYILSAFHYIFHRADIISKRYGVDKLRLVINFSYGYSGGRHDGEIDLEAAIHQLIVKRRECRGPTALVLPAGNTFLDRMHGRICEEDFDERVARLRWRIQPNDHTSSYLELWFWQGFDPWGFTIELRDPWGRLRVSLPMGQQQVFPVSNDHGHVIGEVSADKHRAGAGISGAENNVATDTISRWRVVVAMAPTEPEDDRLPGVCPGKWTVTIRRAESAQPLSGPIHCWIQRATDVEVFRSGSRQSYFDDPKDVLYTEGKSLENAEDRFFPGGGDLKEEDTDDAFVHRFGNLNGIATGGTTLLAAGYRLGAGLNSKLKYALPSRYSSAGTLGSGWPTKKVDCSSMSDRSRVLIGTIAAGVRSGSLSLVQGTSVAAPFIVRQLATIFTTADDATVQNAAGQNYLSLLSGYTDPSGSRSLTRARLGSVRIPPHWQPGVDVDLL